MLQRLCDRGVEHGMSPRQFPTYGPFGEPKGNADYIKTRWGCGGGRREIGGIGRAGARPSPGMGEVMKGTRSCVGQPPKNLRVFVPPRAPCLPTGGVGARLSFHRRATRNRRSDATRRGRRGYSACHPTYTVPKRVSTFHAHK